MKKKALLFSIIPLLSIAQAPTAFTSKGIGGGGALFSPSINPANTNEIYMACDMSELFHTTNQGGLWNTVHFGEIQGGHYSKVCFTNNASVLYSIDYTSVQGNDQVVPTKSTDGGVTWTPLSGNPDNSEATYFIAANYNNPNQVIIAYYCGIYISLDGGTTFNSIYTCASNNAGNHIAGVFFEGSNIYIGTNDGLVYSNNSGNSFSLMTTSGIPTGENILSFTGAKQGNNVRFFCLTGSSVYAGVQHGSEYYGNYRGVYTMDNANGNWNSKTTGITLNTDYPTFISMAENDINIAYVSGGSASGSPIVMKTTNSGGQWNHVFNSSGNQNIITGWCGQSGDHGWSWAEAPFGFQVCPLDAQKVVITDYGFVHMSNNGGTDWKQLYVNNATENAAANNTPKFKSYSGVGVENTTNWQVMWLDADNMFASFSDINGIKSKDKGDTWSFVNGLTQNSTYRILKHSNGNIYAATSTVHDIYQSTRLTDTYLDAANSGRISYSTDNGNSFQVLHDFGHPVIWLAADPTNANRMYASVIHSTQGGIYVTNNLSAGTGSTWTKLTNPPRTQGHPYNIVVLNNGDLVASYSGRRASNQFTASAGVFYSTDGGNTWSDRSHTNMQYWTMDVVIDPADNTQSTWYACVYSGWGSIPANTGGVYRTTDKGLNWTKISNEYRAMSCTVNPNNTNEMYYTTETNGLWYTGNIKAGSPTFTQVAAYPFREPVRVFFNPHNMNEVWVSSFGNGMKVGAIPTGIETNENNNQIKVFPNPANGDFAISYANAKGDILTIYNLDGKEIYQTTINENIWNISTANFAAGIYILKITGNNQVLTQRLIITH